MPLRREVLSLRPYVVLYHNFVTDSEAEDIKRVAQPTVSATMHIFLIICGWKLKMHFQCVF